MDNRDQIISTLLDDLNKLDSSDFISYNGLELVLSTSNRPNLSTSLSSIFRIIEILPDAKVSIKITSSKFENVLFFFDEVDFINRIKISIEEFESYNLILIHPKGKPESDRVIKKDNTLFCKNYLIYKGILEFLFQSKEFAQFSNESTKTFTLISKEYGVFHLGYFPPNYQYFYSINIEGKLERLKSEFQKKEFIQFFKEIVVTSVHSTIEKNRFQIIIRQLDSIIDLTSKDYEAYVSNFAIDKIKSEFREERESYFENIDRSISSIGKQVVSFPLTFAASVFASYKVQDKPGVILLILFAYFLYTVIAILILRMTSYNVKCLRLDINAEEKEISTAYGKIYSNFEADFNKIKKKVFNLRVIIIVLYSVLILLLVLFTLYAAQSMAWVDFSECTNWISPAA